MTLNFLPQLPECTPHPVSGRFVKPGIEPKASGGQGSTFTKSAASLAPRTDFKIAHDVRLNQKAEE